MTEKRVEQKFAGSVDTVAGRDFNVKNLYQGGTPTARRLQEKILFKLAFGIDCSDAAATEIMKLQAVSFGPKELQLAWDTGCLKYSEAEGLVAKTSWLKSAYGIAIVALAFVMFSTIMLRFEIVAGQSRADVLWAVGLIVIFALMIYGGIRQYLLPQLIAIRIRRALKKGLTK